MSDQPTTEEVLLRKELEEQDEQIAALKDALRRWLPDYDQFGFSGDDEEPAHGQSAQLKADRKLLN